MPGLQDDDVDKVERLKSALWHAVGGIVDALSLDQNINATPQFIGALTELVWSQIYNSGRDLEAFTKHAGRSTIDTKDVMLLTRRNEGLQELLQNCLNEIVAKKH
ncbi:kinetochore component CENP-S-domain-containing protein [Delphinella strobiligena]|nr:kinetochore component CENP-S-domain-containing protein [Delphinella strobiligena]